MLRRSVPCWGDKDVWPDNMGANTSMLSLSRMRVRLSSTDTPVMRALIVQCGGYCTHSIMLNKTTTLSVVVPRERAYWVGLSSNDYQLIVSVKHIIELPRTSRHKTKLSLSQPLPLFSSLCVQWGNHTIKYHLLKESNNKSSNNDSENTIVTNYCILYAKQYIYLKKLKDKNKCTTFNIDFLGYMSPLKHVFTTEESICSKNNEKLKFDKFNIIYENL